jgi:hypothetical protein
MAQEALLFLPVMAVTVALLWVRPRGSLKVDGNELPALGD